IHDLAISSNDGEFVVYFGDGAGGFVDAGRSWSLVSLPQTFESRTHGLDAGDLNRDGMAEIWMGDVGIKPGNLALWNNASR
ncbi:MAG: FG-GAP-like repeat-containing protein, partial [Planctomycetota bacterium]